MSMGGGGHDAAYTGGAAGDDDLGDCASGVKLSVARLGQEPGCAAADGRLFECPIIQPDSTTVFLVNDSHNKGIARVAGRVDTGVAPSTTICSMRRPMRSRWDGRCFNSDSKLLRSTGGSCVTLSDIPFPLLEASDGRVTAQIPDTMLPGIHVAQVRSRATAAQSDPVIAVQKLR